MKNDKNSFSYLCTGSVHGPKENLIGSTENKCRLPLRDAFPAFKEGDIIGCGLSTVECPETHVIFKSVYFTKNGDLLGHRSRFLKIFQKLLLHMLAFC